MLWTPCAALLLLAVLAGPASAADEPAVAVVSHLSGLATVARGEGKAAPLRALDWLPAGAVVEVGPRSAVTLVFASGARFELGEKTRAALAAAGPRVRSGTLRTLGAVPPLPPLAAIAEEEGASARSGAIRLRQSGHIRALYPRADAAIAADAATLRFEGAAGTSYRVRIEEESTGRVAFEVEAPAGAVPVAAGALRPGRRYSWEVRDPGADPPERRSAAFHTLGPEDVARRASLRAALEVTADGETLGLLAEVDRRLGLLAEAAEGFQRALTRSPDSEPLRRLLARVESRLADRREEGTNPR